MPALESLAQFRETLSLDASPAALAQGWTDMWNRLMQAEEIVARDCRVYFGRKPNTDRRSTTTGASELQEVVDGIAAQFPGIRYSFGSEPRHQWEGHKGGLVTLLWNVEAPGASRRTGIDLLRWRDGRIREVWSITGDLELPAMR